MSKPIHPEDGIVISKKWLEELMLQDYRSSYGVLEEVLENSQPLKPVLEVAFNAGVTSGILCTSMPNDNLSDKLVLKHKTEFLNTLLKGMGF